MADTILLPWAIRLQCGALGAFDTGLSGSAETPRWARRIRGMVLSATADLVRVAVVGRNEPLVDDWTVGQYRYYPLSYPLRYPDRLRVSAPGSSVVQNLYIQLIFFLEGVQ